LPEAKLIFPLEPTVGPRVTLVMAPSGFQTSAENLSVSTVAK